MPGLVPGIHVLAALKPRKTWMAGTSPAMTKKRIIFKRLEPENAGCFFSPALRMRTFWLLPRGVIPKSSPPIFASNVKQQAHLRIPAARYARVMPESRAQEGRGECRVPAHPQPRVVCSKHAR